VDEVREAVMDVVDPELGVNIVDLGLVYGISVEDDGPAVIEMTLTSAACPLTDVIEDQTAQSLEGIVPADRITWLWQPPWGAAKRREGEWARVGRSPPRTRARRQRRDRMESDFPRRTIDDHRCRGRLRARQPGPGRVGLVHRRRELARRRMEERDEQPGRAHGRARPAAIDRRLRRRPEDIL